MHMRVFERLRQWAHAVKRDVLMLYLAARDPRVPWYDKVVTGWPYTNIDTGGEFKNGRNDPLHTGFRSSEKHGRSLGRDADLYW
jgi:hypothetical protein